MIRPRRTIDGDSGPIQLGRTREGVATIRAGARNDVLRGLGYCHARDRGLQILFVRILGRGEGSRWLDPSDSMLAIDRFFRRLDFLGDAAAEYDRLSPADRSAFDAYASGMNAYFGAAGLPWELKLLGYSKGFTPWTFADSVVTGKVIGYVSLGSTQGDLERWIIDCIRAGVPKAALEELFPGGLDQLDVELIRNMKHSAPVVPPELWSVPGLPWAVASNSWVVSGSRTASGKPLLANDPHLEINRIPPVWYEAALRWKDDGGGERYAIGATMPGAPGIVIGRNRDLAWGVTYSYMDCVDSWIEDIRDGQYRRGDAWMPLRVREEVIERKGKAPVTDRYYATSEHGTLDTEPDGPGFYLATRWSNGEDTAAQTVTSLIAMLEARTVEEGRAALGRLDNSAWNIVFADRSGAIGSQMTGRMPLRRPGTSGLVPLPGWDPANDWRGFADRDDLPRSLNPVDGLVVAANDDLNHLGRLAPITLAVVPYRAERIRRRLEAAGDRMTVDDMLSIQLDLTSTQAERFMPLILPLLDAHRPGDAAEVLRRWDLRYEVGSRGAVLFERIYRALYDVVFGGRLGASALQHLRADTMLIQEFYYIFDRVLLSNESAWFAGRSRADVYREAIDRVLESTPEPRPERGPIRFRHIILGGRLPNFLGFDPGPFALSGGRATVSQLQVGTIHGRESAGGPSYRMATDLATDEVRTSLPGGPSDRRFSRWYGNETLAYLAGQAKLLRGNAEDHDAS